MTIGTPLRRQVSWWRIVSGVVILLVTFWLLAATLSNKNFNWPVVWDRAFSPVILGGVWVTVQLTVIAQVLGMAGGALLAIMTQSRNVVARLVAQVYIWFFRGTPLLVQLIFWYNLGLLFPRIGLVIPLLGIDWAADTNALITPFGAALLGLALNEVAYMTEIFRGGILGVPRGQMEAALSVGASNGLAMRRIVLPQTARIVIPPLGNQFIGLLKTSSLVSVIGGGDLLTVVQHDYGQSFQVIPLLAVACLWYLAMTTIATLAQTKLESMVDPERRRGQGQNR